MLVSFLESLRYASFRNSHTTHWTWIPNCILWFSTNSRSLTNQHETLYNNKSNYKAFVLKYNFIGVFLSVIFFNLVVILVTVYSLSFSLCHSPALFFTLLTLFTYQIFCWLVLFSSNEHISVLHISSVVSFSHFLANFITFYIFIHTLKLWRFI